MFEFTETISIDAPSSSVWDLMHEVESWWLASNPEHESLERLGTNEALDVGARLRIREEIAGVPGEATGTITHFEPGSEVTWEVAQARYRWHGIPFTIGEGVTWRIEPTDDQTTNVSAHVWATLPDRDAGSAPGSGLHPPSQWNRARPRTRPYRVALPQTSHRSRTRSSGAVKLQRRVLGVRLHGVSD